MTFTKKAAIFLATITLTATSCTVIATSTQAATFTKDEIQEVHNIQNYQKKLLVLIIFMLLLHTCLHLSLLVQLQTHTLTLS